MKHARRAMTQTFAFGAVVYEGENVDAEFGRIAAKLNLDSATAFRK
jgi:hypothetical protein